METKVIASRMAEKQVLNLIENLAEDLTRTEQNLGNGYEAEDRRAVEIANIKDALKEAIEAASRLFAYEVESRTFVEAESNK